MASASSLNKLVLLPVLLYSGFVFLEQEKWMVGLAMGRHIPLGRPRSLQVMQTWQVPGPDAEEHMSVLHAEERSSA